MPRTVVRALGSFLLLAAWGSGLASARQPADPTPREIAGAISREEPGVAAPADSAATAPVGDAADAADVAAPEAGMVSRRLTLAPGRRQFPPRMFSAPTGEILPSLGIHAASGWSVGFTDHRRDRTWAVSAGLGGVGEVTLSSAGITHIADPSSDALAGFRVRIPLGWVSPGLGDRVSLAANLAATDESRHRSSGFTGKDGVRVESLSYGYRETTMGAAMTLDLGDRTRLTGVAHLTDLRATDIRYRVEGGGGSREGQKEVYPSFAAGIDHAANAATHVLLEARTVPHVGFLGNTGELRVDNRLEATGGIRFLPLRFLGFDATVSVDDRALGIADMEIGFGLHVILSPAITGRPGSRAAAEAPPAGTPAAGRFSPTPGTGS